MELKKTLCALDGTSGREYDVRSFILKEIDGTAEIKTDALGNIIAFKKGKKTPENKIMIDAHMDEVGVIVTAVTSDGFLKFASVGGIDPAVLITRKIKFMNGILGVVCAKPTHLLTADERKKKVKADSLVIDIGASSKDEAENLIELGETGIIKGKWCEMGDLIRTKAADDRLGCAALIEMLKSYDEYDFYATFTVQEEVGLRGASAAAFSVAPDICFALEATTASDINGVSEENQVCNVGGGVAVSFMDRATLYDKGLFDLSFKVAKENGIKIQAKRAVAGGNNAGSINKSGKGVRTLALSVPCRYIHSASCVFSLADANAQLSLLKVMIGAAAND